MAKDEKCTLCGGVIGPDITDRPMCYGCGPLEMVPHERPEVAERRAESMADHHVRMYGRPHPLLDLLR